MPAGNNNFVDTDAKIKDFLNAVLSSEGIVVDIRRTFINYNGVNRSRVFARRANEMASKGGNEKFVVIALMCYPALQWILQAQDIDRLVEELREQNPDESVSRMSNIQRVLESSLGGCKPQLRLEMRKVFFARCQQLVDAVDEAMNAAVFHNPKSKAGKISLAMALLRGSILETDPVTAVTIRTHFDSIIEDVAAMAGDTIKPLVMQLAPNEGNAESSEAAFLFHNTEVLLKEYSRIANVMILTATILVLLNIPFFPNSEWEKMCEFIKRPQTVQQSSEVNTDIVQSAASIALQEIMDKYGLPEGAEEDKSPEIAAQAKPETQEPEKEKSSAQSNIEVKKQTEPQQEEVLNSAKADALKQDESIDVEIPTGFAEKSKEIPKQNQTQKAEPPVLEDVQLEDAESIKDEISLTDNVELEAEEDDSLDTLTSLGAEDSSETDVAALDEELKELEALNAAPTSFAAFNPEDDEKIDESEEFDIASMMGEPVDSEQDSTDVELGVEPETKMDELPYVELEEVLEAPIEEPPKSKAKQVRKSKKETAPAPPSENAFHVKMPAVSEEDGVQPKAEQKPIEKEVPKEESDSKPKKKATTPKRNRAAGDTSPFGRGFQDRTKSGTGKSRKKTVKKEETPADTGQMSFDEATTGVIECKVNEP